MAADDHRTKRIVTVAAATCISLACGTNYAYSAWAPQFASRLQLSATQSNIIGVMGNVGMYATGIPVGLVVDNKGSRPAVMVGVVCLALGYFPISRAYDGGPGSMSVAWIDFFSFLTGMGGCSAFSASIKASALAWPNHRGTATGLPLSAFGLSALFFSMISSVAFPGDTSGFLLLLAIGTPLMVLASVAFLRVPHTSTYSALATDDPSPRPRRGSNQLHRTKSGQSGDEATIASKPHSSIASNSKTSPSAGDANAGRAASPETDAAEASSLMSAPDDIDTESIAPIIADTNAHSHSLIEVSGMALLKHIEFYQLFILCGSLTGVGLMTINNIGNDARALWLRHDPSVSKSFIAHRQFIHVSIISSFSFLGRLLSGIGSDLLVKRLHVSRFWCVAASACICILAQVVGTQLQDPNHLWLLSGLSGLAYGALFGVYPSLVADAFGLRGLSLNWGFMILGPVLFSNIFNIAYGAIYDSHSVVVDDGSRECSLGVVCYRDAYWISLAGAIVGLAFCLWSTHHEHRVRRQQALEARRGHRA